MVARAKLCPPSAGRSHSDRSRLQPVWTKGGSVGWVCLLQARGREAPVPLQSPLTASLAGVSL